MLEIAGRLGLVPETLEHMGKIGGADLGLAGRVSVASVKLRVQARVLQIGVSRRLLEQHARDGEILRRRTVSDRRRVAHGAASGAGAASAGAASDGGASAGAASEAATAAEAPGPGAPAASASVSAAGPAAATPRQPCV